MGQHERVSVVDVGDIERRLQARQLYRSCSGPVAKSVYTRCTITADQRFEKCTRNTPRFDKCSHAISKAEGISAKDQPRAGSALFIDRKGARRPNRNGTTTRRIMCVAVHLLASPRQRPCGRGGRLGGRVHLFQATVTRSN